MTMTPAQIAFGLLRRTRSWHLGTETYTDVAIPELGNPSTDSPALFKPRDLKEGIEEYFDYMLKHDCRALRTTWHYWEGMCMWDSTVTGGMTDFTPRSLLHPACTWRGSNRGFEVSREVLRVCNAYHREKIIYYNVADFYFDLQVDRPLERIDWITAHLTEIARICAEVGGPDPIAIFLDGYGDFVGIGIDFAELEWEAIRAVILQLWPNILIIVNNHETPLIHGDIRNVERTAGEDPGEEEPLPGITEYPVVADDTWHQPSPDGEAIGAANWFRRIRATAETILMSIAQYGRIYRCLKNGTNYVHQSNISLSGTGKFADDTKLMLDEHFDAPGTQIYYYDFTQGSFDEDGVEVEDVADSELVRTYPPSGGFHVALEPSGQGIIANSGQPAVYKWTTDAPADCTVKLGFMCKNAYNSSVQVYSRSNDDAGESDRNVFTISGGTFSAALACVTSGPPYYQTFGADGTLTGDVTDEIVEETRMELWFRRTGDDMRGKLMMNLHGEMVAFGRQIATSTVHNDGGTVGFIIETPAEGIVLLDIEVTVPNNAVPLPPTLTLLGDETNGHYVGFRKYPNTDRIKTYRSSDNGETWDIVNVDREGQFIDQDLIVGTTYQYRSLAVSADWIISSKYSNVLTLTATESDVLLGQQQAAEDTEEIQNQLEEIEDGQVDPRGAGADLCTINCTLGGDPVADADVWITATTDPEPVVAGALQTDSNGNATFLLDAGNTYYLWVQKDGVNSVIAEEFVAEADA